MLDWLKHAFAIDPSGAALPSHSQAKAIDRVLREVVRREMILPAQLILDSSGPLSYVAGQSIRFFEPFLATILDPAATREFAAFLERRGAVEYISKRLEELSHNPGDSLPDGG